MRPIERARRDPRGLFKRTAARATGSAPWQTTANSARPSSTRGVHVSGPVISTTVLTQRTRTQPLPLSTMQVYFQVVRQRARREPSGGIFGRRRRRCVNVAVDLPNVRLADASPTDGAQDTAATPRKAAAYVR